MRLHNERHTVLMSPADSKLIENLYKLDIDVIPTLPNKSLRTNEQYHADMQLLVINKTAFVSESIIELYDILKGYFDELIVCEKGKESYPDNVFLNAAFIDNKLYCKVKSLSIKVKEYCESQGIELVNVNQGYTKCSTLIVNDKAIITADPTIHKAAKTNGVKSLLITPGFIKLDGADYGFIGGSSGKVGDTVIFFGNILRHPDCDKIIDFLKCENTHYCCISEDVMNDIGGLVELS